MNSGIQRLLDAADSGDRYAQFALGCAYLQGDGVRKNRVIGLKWMILAAGQGDEDADVQCQLLGEQLTDRQERRAVVAALRWKFQHALRDVLEQLMAYQPCEQNDDLPVYVKLPRRLN